MPERTVWILIITDFKFSLSLFYNLPLALIIKSRTEYNGERCETCSHRKRERERIERSETFIVKGEGNEIEKDFVVRSLYCTSGNPT